jgi:hypothetical protein
MNTSGVLVSPDAEDLVAVAELVTVIKLPLPGGFFRIV